MSSPSKTQSKSPKTEIIIAAIGVLGVIATGILSNWDKILGRTVQAQYSGYRPTGDIETELRYYFEIVGLRRQFENMNRVMQDQERKSRERAGLPANGDSGMTASPFDEKAVDEIVRIMLPSFKKNFTIQEIQELNRFYSTEIMQAFVKKQPLVMIDSMPAIEKWAEDRAKGRTATSRQ
jgi:hypothetical protein